MTSHNCAILLTTLILSSPLLRAADIPVTLQIDAAQFLGDFHPVWRFFGYDECNFTYMKFGQQLLGELGELGPDQVFIRCHHLLTSGDGSAGMKWGSTGIYHLDPGGAPVYDFTIVDRIFDTYIQHGVKPYVEIGFMPKDLSTRPDLYPTHITPTIRQPVDGGQAYPPTDFKQWRELIRRWAEHCRDRYGAGEVGKWYWEVWNEPDISYWKGTPQQYCELYDYTVDGVRSAIPKARVGGPEAAGNDRWLTAFLQHCLHGKNYATGGMGSPIDFISFHAKGSPRFVDGHVRMGISNQLRVISRNFAAIAAIPEFRNLPVVIGESDPDGMAARPVSEAPQLGYRNTTLFSSYTTAAFARTFELARKYQINLDGAITWSFEFENKPFFAGYRTLASNGVDLPVLNVFRMFAQMGGTRLAVQDSADLGVETMIEKSVRDRPDVYALASLADKKLCVMVWNYHDDDVPGPAASVDIHLDHLPPSFAGANLTEFRIDHDHSDSYSVWQSLGSPADPNPQEYERMKQAGQLALMHSSQPIRIENGNATIHVNLPRQAVSLLVLQSP